MFNNQPAESSEPMSDDRRVVVDITKRQVDRLIEFWLRALVAFIFAFALVALYYAVRHN